MTLSPRPRWGLLLTVGIAAVSGAPMAARAQDAASDAIQLDEITVQGAGARESATSPVRGYVARRTVTGTKTDTPILEVPQSVSTVTRDQMDAREVQTVGQALDYSAGVVSQPFGTDPRFDAPIIRGFSAANSQYLNGLKLMRDQGATAIEPYGLERIDVLRGPSSVLYGQGNPGGLINMVSKRPVWDTIAEVSAQAGSFDNYSGSFDVGGPIGKGSELAYRLTGLARTSDTQTDFVDEDRYFFAPALTWQPGDGTSLTLLASIQHDTPQSPIGLPAEYTVNAPKGMSLSTNTYLGDPNFESSNRTLSNLGYEFSHNFDETFAVRQNARYTWLNWDYDSLYYNGLSATDPDVAMRGTSTNSENLGTFTIDNQVEKSFATGPVEHTVLVGLDYRNHNVDTSTTFGTAPSVNVFAPSYYMAIVNDPWYESSTDGTISQLGLYGQDQVRFGPWLLTLGLRQDWANVDSTTDSNFGDTVQDQNDSATTGRVGLTYLFANGVAPYASYSTSFEPVIGNMPAVLGGEPFKPSEGKQYEAGIKYQPVGINALFTVALYNLTQSNVSTLDEIGGVSYTVQTGEIRVQGIEFSATASLADGLNLIANYTYMDPEITAGQYSGNRPANVPDYLANAWLDYTIKGGVMEGLGFGGGVRFVGERYALDDNALLLDSNTLFDAALHYEKGPFKLQLNVNNIADEKYVSSCGYFGCFYGDGRTVLAQLSYKW